MDTIEIATEEKLKHNCSNCLECNPEKLPSFEYDEKLKKLVAKENIGNDFVFQYYVRIIAEHAKDFEKYDLSVEKTNEPELTKGGNNYAFLFILIIINRIYVYCS